MVAGGRFEQKRETAGTIFSRQPWNELNDAPRLKVEAEKNLTGAASAEVGTASRGDNAEVRARDIQVEVIAIVGKVGMIQNVGKARARF